MEQTTAAPIVYESLRKAREEVLAENTAQAVFKHLDELRDHRQTFAGRWIWELLQNARDAAQPTGVSVHIRETHDQLTFAHDGKAFAEKEIAHLIYHGSTKVDSSDVGHFGSGFISTHLLSPCIRIRGGLEDGRRFDFGLDRSGHSVEDLYRGMQASWDAFAASIQHRSDQSDVGTEFVYTLSEDATHLTSEGLEQLRTLAPLLLAFCPEIRALQVARLSESWSAVRGDSEKLGPEAELLTIEFSSGEECSKRFVALAGDSDVQVAIPLRDGPSLAIDLQERTPRLFVVFPLLTTDRLHLPVVINSRRFKPREARDGILLDQESPAALENRRLVDRAGGYIIDLLKHAAHRRWLGLEGIVGLSTDHAPDWVDEEWLRQFYRGLVEAIRDIPLVPTLGGEWVAPRSAWIPLTADNPSSLWALLAGVRDATGSLPAQGRVETWSSNLSSWSRLYSDGSELAESFSVRRLASLVADRKTVDGVSRLLHDESAALDWLSALANGVAARDASLFDGYRVLPSQAGELRLRNELLLDGGIADQLKDIASGIGKAIRDGLLDRCVETPDLARLFKTKTQDNAVDEIVSALKQTTREGRAPAGQAASMAQLLWWLAGQSDYKDQIDGLPVTTAERNDDEVMVVSLERNGESAPLAPPRFWPPAALPFASLFPKRRVLDELTAEIGGDRTLWDWLAEEGFIRLSPLYRTSRRERFPKHTTGLGDGELDHSTVGELRVSDIAFLNDEDIGILNKARKSRSTALELVRFLVYFVAAADTHGLTEETVKCECGQMHAIRSAAWLVPLLERQWIPIGSDANRATSRVSATNLSTLVREDLELIRRLGIDPGAQLLRAMHVSPADFQLRLVAKDEDAQLALVTSMVELARAAGNDVERVQALLSEISEHPALIGDIEAARVRRQRVLNNQRLGGLVEQLLRDELEAAGLRVTRTGVGSDFEVESDFIAGGEEVLLEVRGSEGSILLEVKSVRTDHAKMTPVQARKACDERSRFALCVVPLRDDAPTPEIVRSESRFVFDVGDEITAHWSDYTGLLEATDEARRRRGAVEIEIVEGQVRFKIDRSLWANGLPLDAAVAEILRRSHTDRR